ncbi:hypothetical protein [Limnohabitans radicicola]|uniref:Uncharacterized protein n=1 Tax=Limnohabitans radicicola TaxID=2771427 RepID=A0A927FJQ2_9BURK|nr:hypothetical protein [Limnohabitans radicicola]MBD8052016.1 hypothetical protein [Limnohabitans radicicola]
MHEKQLKTLELAGRIQYFTLEHLYQAGIYTSPSKSTARVHLRDLKAYGFITESHYGVSRGFGRLPALHGLTPKAVRYLTEVEGHQLETIKVSKSRKNQEYETKAPADYFHRVGLLDSVLACLLMLDQAETKEEVLELYFRRFGMHEPRRTAIELQSGRLEPDAILSFTAEDRKRLYLVEFYEDSANNERIKRAIFRHGEAIHTGAPSTALGLGVGHRVLLVFRHEHTARAIMKFINEAPTLAGIADRFLFKTHESILKDAFDNWATSDGVRTNIY